MTPEELIQTWYAATTDDSRDEGIMFALLRLARRHPQWFDAELTGDPLQMLFEAIAAAQHDMVSRKLIEAAYWLVKSNEDRLADPPQPEPKPLPMTETDPLKRLYRRLRDNVTQGVAGDVMQMPPSWGELLTAVHEAAFPDGDDDTTDREAAEAAAFAAGAKAQREADVAEMRLIGIPSVARLPLVTDDDIIVTGGTEAAKCLQAKGWDAGYSEGHAAGYRDAVARFAGCGEA